MVSNCNQDISRGQIWRIMQKPSQKERFRLELNGSQVSRSSSQTRPGVNLHSCPTILVWSHLHRCWAGISGVRLIKPPWSIFAGDAQFLILHEWWRDEEGGRDTLGWDYCRTTGGKGHIGAHKATVICRTHVLGAWAEALNYHRYTTACPNHSKVWSFKDFVC